MKRIILLLILIALSVSVYSQDILLLKTSGKVVIGDTSQISTPGLYNLYVQNGVMTEKVKVALKNQADWSDDSFDKTPELTDVKKSIDKNSHLINIPSAQFLVENGYDLQDMDARLLEQIEWLWQYTLKLSEENKLLKEELNGIKQKLDSINE